MKDSFFVACAVIVVFVAVLAAGFTFYALLEYNRAITGRATDVATTNVTVASSGAINFTISRIDWGSGTVLLGAQRAVLSTHDGAVIDGTWQSQSQGFVLENIGNVNVTIHIRTDKDADTFIGGTAGGGPEYKYNITNIEDGSCYTPPDFLLGEYYDVNTSIGTGGSEGTLVCEAFNFADGSDEIKIDIMLAIPSDSRTGVLGDVMTATATAI